MTVVKWDSWQEIDELRPSYFQRTGETLANIRALADPVDWSLQIEISETENEFVIQVELPNLNQHDVKIAAEDGILTIHVERMRELRASRDRLHCLEYFDRNFTRNFELPDNVDADHILASFRDGVLDIQLPKISEARSKSSRSQS